MVLLLGGIVLTLRGGTNVFAAVGFVLAWLWWSLAVPRWRRWALARVADPAELERLAVATGLQWKRDSFFSRTELPPRD